jgi:hypothetical protein
VVIVHGLYMHGLAMLPLQRRLGACGFHCRQFSYPSLRLTVAQNAARLAQILCGIDTPVVHFLCHSLGGLVVRAMLVQSSWQRPGRVLTLGTPHLGSFVAKRLGASSVFGPIVGNSLVHGLDGDLPPWPDEREVATIAGDKAVGMGRLVPGLPKPNDGTVALAETDLGPGFPRVVLPVSHTSMLFSRSVASYACCYLESGRFPSANRPAASSL